MGEADSGSAPAAVAPMNLLLFIDGLGSGGAQRQFAHLARGLAARGHTVTVAVYNDQDHFAGAVTESGASIVRLAKPSKYSPRVIAGLARLYRERRAQAVIAFLRSPAAMAEVARLLHPAMKVIAAERSAFYGPMPLSLRAKQHLHRLASFVTVNSDRQNWALKRAFPAIAGRVVTIRNGVDLPASPAQARPAAGDGEVRLAAVSSLMPYKNSVRLAEAVAVARDEFGVNVSVTWVGETFAALPDYGAYRETCARIAELGLERHWRWAGVTHDVAGAISGHDALVHPSLFEGTSNAVCEALALGLPVLAGDIADHQDMLARSGAGMLFDPHDPRSIAAAISRFAGLEDSARAEMGQKGRRLIAERYSFEQMVTDYECLARAAADGDRAPPAALLGEKRGEPCAG
jgi:glycosyltransferase involved in cell wall biosynthesis